MRRLLLSLIAITLFLWLSTSAQQENNDDNEVDLDVSDIIKKYLTSVGPFEPLSVVEEKKLLATVDWYAVEERRRLRQNGPFAKSYDFLIAH